MNAVHSPYDDQVKEEIRSRIDIAAFIGRYVKLRSAGRNMKGLCPFHKDKDPSFNVNSDKGIYHCFGCGKGGDIFSFLMEIDGLTFPEALRQLADEAGVALPERHSPSVQQSPKFPSKTEMLALNETAMRFYYSRIKSNPQAVEFFKKRGLTAEVVREFKLGYAPPGWRSFADFAVSRGVSESALLACGLASSKSEGSQAYDRFRNRIIFPLTDITGKPVGFAGRSMDNETMPKYLNSPETPVYRKSRFLYGIDKARNAIKELDYVLIVEGYMDFLGLYQREIRNCVATSGTALTPEHVSVIRRFTKNLVFVFDGDQAGMTAAERATFTIAPFDVDARVLVLPTNEDPDTYIQKKGKDSFLTLVKAAQDSIEFVINKAIADHNGRTPRGKSEVINHCRPLFESIKDTIVRSSCIKQLAETLDIDERIVYSKIKNRKETSPDPNTARKTAVDFLQTLEGNFIRLIFFNPQLITMARERITPESLTDQFSANLYSIILTVYTQSGKLDQCISRAEDPETKTIFSLLAVYPVSEENAEEELFHTMKKLEIKYLRNSARQNRKKMENNPGQRAALLEENNRIMSQINRLEKGS
ncbi:MAG: DNA primase [Chitinivibrionales bacterium]|nr:DNA primase [Chitinivibrionales bacterium]